MESINLSRKDIQKLKDYLSRRKNVGIKLLSIGGENRIEVDKIVSEGTRSKNKEDFELVPDNNDEIVDFILNMAEDRAEIIFDRKGNVEIKTRKEDVDFDKWILLKLYDSTPKQIYNAKTYKKEDTPISDYKVEGITRETEQFYVAQSGKRIKKTKAILLTKEEREEFNKLYESGFYGKLAEYDAAEIEYYRYIKKARRLEHKWGDSGGPYKEHWDRHQNHALKQKTKMEQLKVELDKVDKRWRFRDISEGDETSEASLKKQINKYFKGAKKLEEAIKIKENAKDYTGKDKWIVKFRDGEVLETKAGRKYFKFGGEYKKTLTAWEEKMFQKWNDQ